MTLLHDSMNCITNRNGNGKKPAADANPFDDHDEEWDENDNSENVLTDNGE
jgi:protein kinase C and casein kinase substrate in neurons protein